MPHKIYMCCDSNQCKCGEYKKTFSDYQSHKPLEPLVKIKKSTKKAVKILELNNLSSIVNDLKKEINKLKEKLFLLRKYHSGDNTITKNMVIEALTEGLESEGTK